MKTLLAILLAALALPAAAAADGAAVYGQRCVACHQAGGVGAPGLAPPLAGQLAPRLATEEGRAYFPRVLVSGLSGPIKVGEERFMGVMPSFAQLDDEELAAVLNTVMGEYNAAGLPAGHRPYEAADIAAARAEKLAPHQVLALRKKVLAALGGKP